MPARRARSSNAEAHGVAVGDGTDGVCQAARFATLSRGLALTEADFQIV